jgi:hypothetical protein
MGTVCLSSFCKGRREIAANKHFVIDTTGCPSVTDTMIFGWTRFHFERRWIL